MLLSITAANVLWALVKAWKSPVKCKLMSAIGTTWAYPPPVAPPFKPMTGPSDGSRNATIVFLPAKLSASAKPTVTVDLPSPAGVGLIDVTKINLPSPSWRADSSTEILALSRPYGSHSAAVKPAFSAIFSIGQTSAACAISISVCIPRYHLIFFSNRLITNIMAIS